MAVELCFLASIPLVILGLLFLQALRSGDSVRAAVLGLTLFHESVLVAFPIAYSVATGFVLEGEMTGHVGPGTLVRVMLGETLFVTAFALGMLRLDEERSPAPVARPFAAPGDRALLYLLAGSGVIIYSAQLLGGTETLATATSHADIAVPTSGASLLARWLAGALGFSSLVAATLLMLDPDEPRAGRLMGAVALLLVALEGISGGIRGRATWVISLVMTFGFLKGRRAAIYGALTLMAVFLPLVGYLGGEYRSVYFNELAGFSRLEALKVIGRAAVSGDLSRFSGQGILPALGRRAQGP